MRYGEKRGRRRRGREKRARKEVDRPDIAKMTSHRKLLNEDGAVSTQSEEGAGRREEHAEEN